MTTFRTYAHVGPSPHSFGTFSPNPLPAPGSIASYWSEVVSQNVINGTPYGVVQAPPSEPDKGYIYQKPHAPVTTDFTVTRICIQVVGNRFPTYTSPYEYTLISPTGQVIPVPTSAPAMQIPATAGGGWAFCTTALYVPQATGLWRIDVQRKPGFTDLPTVDAWPNGVSFVLSHTHPEEGILAIEFEGTEVVCPTVTTQVQLGPCTPFPWSFRQPSSLILNFTPALAPGTTYYITWFLANAPTKTVAGTFPPGPSPEMITYPPNVTLYPAVSGTITPPGGQPCSFFEAFQFPVGSSGVTIPPCLRFLPVIFSEPR